VDKVGEMCTGGEYAMDLSGLPPTIAVTVADQICRIKWGADASTTVYGPRELALLLNLGLDLRTIRASSSAIDQAVAFFALESLTLTGPTTALQKLNRCRFLREVVLLNCSSLSRQDYTSFFLSTASKDLLNRLTLLDLRHCGHLPVALLKLVPNLTSLSLSGAALTAIDVQGWKAAMPGLSRLHISETKITTETRKALEALEHDPGTVVDLTRVFEIHHGLIATKKRKKE
jgi:hypothetical protein